MGDQLERKIIAGLYRFDGLSRENSRCSSYFIGSGSCDPDSKSHWPMIFLLILRNKEDGVPGKSLHLRKLL